jgi:hypothetical protein
MKTVFRSILHLAVLCSALLVVAPQARASVAGSSGGIRLQALPAHIYKTRDPGNERTESWTFWLLVETTGKRDLKIEGAKIQLLSGQQSVRTTQYDSDGARALTIEPPFSPKQMDGSPSPSPIYWPQAIRIRSTEAQAAKVDGMRVELTLGEGNHQTKASVVLPVETYVQKTTLIYPFKGKGIFTNAGVTNGGHRNRSGQFALDGVGLDANYAVHLGGDGKKSTDYAGWGRNIVAPADGVIVEVRSDRPDQPDPENSDPKYYAAEYPNQGDPGNHVVIDHGNGEFSMLAHMQAGSVRVKIGDHVVTGQRLGKLGSSGDTITPHLHYQLQSGPDMVWSDGLPCVFKNIDEPTLVRGTYFNAR